MNQEECQKMCEVIGKHKPDSSNDMTFLVLKKLTQSFNFKDK